MRTDAIRALVFGALAALAVGAASVASGCQGEEGTPGAPTALPVGPEDTGAPLVGDASPDAAAPIAPRSPVTTLAGFVRAAASDAGGGGGGGGEGEGGAFVMGAIVVVEVGGIGRPNPAALGADGGLLASFSVDPYVQYSARTGSGGAFALEVPAGTVGLHTFAAGFAERLETVLAVPRPDASDVPDAAHASDASDAGDASATTIVLTALVPGRSADGAPAAIPTATRLTPSARLIAPFAPLTFAVDVVAGSAADPLSEDIFLVEPSAHWAGALVPPTPAVPGEPYPDGDYGLIVQGPGTPGVYTYTVVAASRAGAVSVPTSVVVTVTPTGDPPVSDSGFPRDGSHFRLDGGGVPDGRY